MYIDVWKSSSTPIPHFAWLALYHSFRHIKTRASWGNEYPGVLSDSSLMWPRLGQRVIRNGVTVNWVPLGETLSLWAATYCPEFHFHKYAIGGSRARTGVWEQINLASFHITANGCASVSTRLSLADQNMSQAGGAYLIQAWREAPLWIMNLSWICGHTCIVRCFLKTVSCAVLLAWLVLKRFGTQHVK